VISGIVPNGAENGHFQVDTWQDFASPLLILGRMDLKGAVGHESHTLEDSSPCAPYPWSVGSPMPPCASLGTTARSLSRPSSPTRAAVPAGLSTTTPRRSSPPSRPSTVPDPPASL